jgi:hypothetical protein
MEAVAVVVASMPKILEEMMEVEEGMSCDALRMNNNNVTLR